MKKFMKNHLGAALSVLLLFFTICFVIGVICREQRKLSDRKLTAVSGSVLGIFECGNRCYRDRYVGNRCIGNRRFRNGKPESIGFRIPGFGNRKPGIPITIGRRAAAL